MSKHPYVHQWVPSQEAGIPVERCRACGIMRRMDGKSDDGICSAAVREGRPIKEGLMNSTEEYMYEGMVAARDRLAVENKRLLALLSSVLPELAPGVFICGRSGAERNGLPDRIHVCPSYGADWSATYQRLD